MDIDKKLIDAIITKTSDDNLSTIATPYLLQFNELYKLINDKERSYVELLLEQKPEDYGLAEPFRGLQSATEDDVVAIENQRVSYGGKVVRIEPKYVPKDAYQAYQRMNDACKKDTGKTLLVNSGYRSPAYQAVNFLRWLQYYNYDFKKTLGYVSIPGYSEHSLVDHVALDLMTEEGVSIFDQEPFGRFDETPEYKWLLKHAGEYDYVLTCSPDNNMGFNFEPWHWQYQPKVPTQ